MDLDDLMKNLGPLQESLKKADADRGGTVLEGTAGGGAVKIGLKGDLTITRVVIAPAAAAAAGGDVSMLEDLVQAACNDALRQYRERFGSSPDEQVQKMLGGSGLGAMMGPLMTSLGRKPS
ncbi:MAG: YbaB/EbfC family nucleoid-associated protein [Planctomycetes bacterium]|nr:YbaB/EbfC family nucleoid-associated protein [Planctomycetota bacterium]